MGAVDFAFGFGVGCVVGYCVVLISKFVVGCVMYIVLLFCCCFGWWAEFGLFVLVALGFVWLAWCLQLDVLCNCY